MATDFTQDSVLFFLQSSGGSVKNSELLAHFRAFLQDAENRDRNRELFKKFVNSVAIVKQVDGVSHVLLRKKFKGHVSGAGWDSPGPAENYTEPGAVSLAPPGETRREAVLPAAGIAGKNHKNQETKITQKLEEQQVLVGSDPLIRPVQVGGQQQVKVSPDPVIRPVQMGGQQRNISPDPVIRPVQMGGQQQRNISPDPVIRPVQMGGQQQRNISPDPVIRPVQLGSQQQRNISPDPVIRPVQMGGQQQRNISPDPVIRPVQLGGQQQRNISPDPVTRPVQLGGQQQRNISPDPVIRLVQLGGQQQRNISPEPVIRPVQLGGQQQRNISPDPVIRPVQLGGQQQRNINPDPVIRPVQLGSLSEFSGPGQNTKLGQPTVRLQEPGPPRGQGPGRRFRHRPSYKSAVSQDDDDEEEEEEEKEDFVGPGPGRGSWPQNAPLSVSGRTVSAYPPCIPETPESCSSSSGRTQSSIQHTKEEILVQPRLGPGSVPMETTPIRPSLPSESSRYNPVLEAAPLVPRQGPGLQQVSGSRFKHRPSYKTAVSQDDDDEEEQEEDEGEEAPVRPSPGGGLWLQNAPGRTIPESPESCSSSSGRTVPHIFIQDMEDGEIPVPRRPEASSVPMETIPIRRSLPSELASAGQELRQNQTQSSSPSSILRPSSEDRFYSGDLSSSGSSRASGLSSSEGRGTRSEEPAGLKTIQEVLLRSNRTPAVVPWHRSTGNLYDEEPSAGRLSPLHRSTDCLHDDQGFPPRVGPWHLSTGDLCDDREEAESSEGSTSSPKVQLRSAVERRLSSRLRSRMCRSLGTDLDQILQEGGDVGGAGSDVARLDRLHRISSSLSLFYNRSTSSLSSCPTPPRCPSPANQVEGEERRPGRRSLTSTTSHTQSPVPLEPKEHAWMVNGAVGAWNEIFSLFREDPSLLNKRDFISGFTVLHWISKHGAHRALNTLWYGVEKFGLTFDINAKATGGQTPLHVAAIHGHKKVIQLLVNKFHADVRLRDMAGKRAWQYLSSTAPDILQLLGAPARAALTERGGADDSDWKPKRLRPGLRHHFSSASSGQRPLTFTQLAKVTRSSSIAALLKHKSIPRF